VGVFSLELARLYAYLYQQTDKNYSIVHSLDGYDEVSLTGPFKWITNNQDSLVDPTEWGFDICHPEALSGGTTIEEAAKIFWSVLNGNGTVAQNEVVIVNAGLALYCARPELNLSLVFDQARESLMQGKALNSFKKLVGDGITNI